MRRIEGAEVILSLVADRERANAIAGDLLEESRGRALRFWWLVAQTSILQTGRQLSAAPWAVLGTAIQAILFQFFYMVALFMIMHDSFTTALSWAISPAPALQPEMISWLFVPFSLGMDAARWRPGREYSVIVDWLGLQAILNVAASLFRWEFLGVQGTLSREILAGLACFGVFAPTSFLIATGAAARARYKSLPKAAHA